MKLSEHLDQSDTCTVLTEESKRISTPYPNRIQTSGPSVEAVQDDRRLKKTNGAQVSKCSPTLVTVLLTDRVSNFGELTNYSAVAVRIQGKVEVGSRQG